MNKPAEKPLTERRRARSRAIVLAIGLVLVITIAYVLSMPETHEGVTLKPHPDATFIPSVMNAILPKVSVLPKEDAVPARPAQSGPGISLKAAYARMSQGTAAERMQAYDLIERCMEVDKFKVLNFLKGERCGDLEPGQIAQRVENLYELAEQGHPRAWFKLRMEADGYYGEGQVANTPDMRERLERYRLIAIEHGDPRAIQTELPLLLKSEDPNDVRRALTLQTAVLLNLADELGVPRPKLVLANSLAASIAEKLTPAEAAEAIREGVDLANRSPKP